MTVDKIDHVTNAKLAKTKGSVDVEDIETRSITNGRLSKQKKGGIDHSTTRKSNDQTPYGSSDLVPDKK